MSRLDNYYESINALAAGQPEQFIHASEERLSLIHISEPTRP